MRGLSIVIACTLLFTFAGCSEKTNSTEAGMNTKEPVSTPAPPTQPAPTNQPKAVVPNTAPTQKQQNELTAKVYYPDKQATNLVEKTKQIHWSTTENKYEAAFKALFQTPDQSLVAVWKEQPVKVKFENGIVTVDLEKPIQTGSTVERYMIESLLKTMFQFSEVEKVQILIGGKKVETLSGHIEISQPFTRKSLADL